MYNFLESSVGIIIAIVAGIMAVLSLMLTMVLTNQDKVLQCYKQQVDRPAMEVVLICGKFPR